MVLLENDAFLSELTRLFQKCRSSGSIMLTMKRYDGRTKPEPRKGKLPEPSEYKCLIRANLGNKKITTVVNPKDVNRFHMAYTNVLKGNMDGLKKKDKKSAAKSKAKATQ
ncbi:signal recognition particle 14 kDa protein-like [Mizuhopecten yessoensis]|uniref:Signal recognition particle 14 kDa protein n=1 Tax=Mizuhopecten yessoensis TaxID=6573 RepID=A0A210QWI2_MIZYE|nr:signal recognition particle 14 kDa protein-like [Mizuhopecten yessoensis]OWF53129.1 Signal recognition particle 14 kDa protein [Mizuhopecten yessoensis]